ncbi:MULTISPECIES: serine hydroxymethyltransferase [unclassified Anaerobiospirillum]|uniref:serine hydroxymethyltransferase n=1 Tax=unclassified Anaerobiospirillum TaxID=2647410 RepID=UPI001FF2A1A5|nr:MULTISPECIES: serine hydroxymethyltransferase [unclassified Anaerobiospirillum]MCK0534524.1 serine hydroxymethyltransferase [Anaerobiospirillum sp. NML120511]MCK0539814.1 serine hydroxymethyltransferase [Anaerobiospirillum sp. NML02-A-032]
MINSSKSIAQYDPELFSAMSAEDARQEDHIELIASENYASLCVMEAQGSQLTNKYAEGYPGKRYYGGCEYVDEVERLAIERACKLFKCEYANVQPHAGSQANCAAYMALCNPGDTILGLSLAAGGHLTHGASVSFSGKVYNAVQYGVNEAGELDYEAIRAQALEVKPKVIVSGFSAYSGIVDWKKMREIADEVGAYLIADMAHVAGLVAAGLYPSPIDYAHVVTSTTHKTLGGPRSGLILSNCHDENIYKKLNSAIFPGSQGGPLMHVIAAKAVVFKEAMEPWFVESQKQVLTNARIMCDIIKSRGYKIVSGGTQNHLFLLDFIGLEMTGKDAEAALGKANITVNKNSVPGDPRSPFITSGLRIGTPAVTRRGFKDEEVRELANIICDVLDNWQDESVIESCRARVKALCDRFPVYKD